MTVDRRSYQLYATPVTILAHLIAIALTTLVLVWLLHFRGGFAFNSNNNNKNFNLHPFLMVVGLIVIGGEAIMGYKTVTGTRRARKYFHMIFHLIALAAGILGTVVIFMVKHKTNGKNFVSLHTWFGIITISSYGLQFVLGFFTFFFPGAVMPRRAALRPWHAFYGMVIFLLAICTAETGLLQTFIGLGLSTNEEGLIVNFIGLLLFLFGVTVTLSIILPRGRY